MADQQFAGKIVVIAGSGYGLSADLERRFTQEGAQVVRASAPIVHSSEQAQALAEDTAKTYGKLDVWVNCHESFATNDVETISPELWDRTLATMLSNTFYGAQAAGRHMLAQGHGVIVNVTAIDAYQISEGRAAYSVAAAGIVALTEALGIEWAKRGVRVVGVAQGAIKARTNGVAESTLERRTPLHRLGTSAETAEAILFVASDQASYVVGETLRVDGGWTAYQLF